MILIGAILTDNRREFCGTERHPYEFHLDLNGIEHRRTRVRTPGPNGFVERFNGSVLDEFFRVNERPNLGHRNMGRRPIGAVMSFVSQEG